MSYKELIPKIDKSKMPRHIAMIMDGNGRWAKKIGRDRLFGHKKGRQTVKRMIEVGVEVGLEYLTIYAFSTENWTRPDQEVKGLFKLFMNALLEEIDELNENNVVLKLIGSHDKVEKGFLYKFIETSKKTWNNTGLHVNVALNYGGRKEIVDSVNELIKRVQMGDIITPISENEIEQFLYTNGQPDPDLIIRTSGEKRLSNFLVWQSAYSEFWFTDTLWPDLSKKEFLEAIIDYQSRNRRFGDVK